MSIADTMQYKTDSVKTRDNASLVTPMLLCIQYIFLGKYDTRLRNVSETGFTSVVITYNFAALLRLSTLDKAGVFSGDISSVYRASKIAFITLFLLTKTQGQFLASRA